MTTNEAQAAPSVSDPRGLPWQAFECLPAQPGSWCVGTGPQMIADTYLTPTVFITPWGLDETTASRIVQEHNAALADSTLHAGLLRVVGVWLYMVSVNREHHANGVATAGGWAAAQMSMSKEVLNLMPPGAERDELLELLADKVAEARQSET